MLPVYDSSSDSDTDGKPPPTKKRKLPSLSTALVVPVPVDDPAMHQGRKRSTPFVEGQWVAHIFVPLAVPASSPLRTLLVDVIGAARARVPVVHALDGELHISLTRPLYLRAHQRAEVLRTVHALAVTHAPFAASFATLATLTNDERSRAFLTLEVGAGHGGLRALVDGLAPVVAGLRQEAYYTRPRFHASVAWALLAVPSADSAPAADAHAFETIEDLPPDLLPALVDTFGTRLASSKVGGFEVDRVCVRIGKTISTFALGNTA